VLMGEFVGIRPGKFGELLDLNVDGGEQIAVPLKTVLARLVAEARLVPGERIRIECTGQRASENGNQFWHYKLARSRRSGPVTTESFPEATRFDVEDEELAS
jgi:hypothetical protein